MLVAWKPLRLVNRDFMSLEERVGIINSDEFYATLHKCINCMSSMRSGDVFVSTS